MTGGSSNITPKSAPGGTKDNNARSRGKSREIPDLDSPTTIVGKLPEFTSPDHAVVQAARSTINPKDRTRPVGWENDGVMCYRNSVLAMLLTSSRFMGYIQNHHQHKIGDMKESNVLEAGYRDTMSRIYELWKVSEVCSETRGRATFMNWVWQCLTAERIDGRTFDGAWKDNGAQQCVCEFLEHLFSCIKFDFTRCHQLALEELSFNSMFQTEMLQLRRCVTCRKHGLNEKVRGRHAEQEYVWKIHLPPLIKASSSALGSNLRLKDLLLNLLKSEGQAYYCDTHENEWTQQMASEPSGYALEQKKQDRLDYKDWEWKRFYHIPEVLFMSIVRFQHIKTNKTFRVDKDMRQIEIPAILDLSQMMDDDAPADSYKYRLSSVIMHKGKSVNSGHYIIYTEYDGKWYKIDDEVVSEADFEAINNHTELKKQQLTPYLLCWEKIILGECDDDLDKQQAVVVDGNSKLVLKVSIGRKNSFFKRTLDTSEIGDIASLIAHGNGPQIKFKASLIAEDFQETVIYDALKASQDGRLDGRHEMSRKPQSPRPKTRKRKSEDVNAGMGKNPEHQPSPAKRRKSDLSSTSSQDQTTGMFGRLYKTATGYVSLFKPLSQPISQQLATQFAHENADLNNIFSRSRQRAPETALNEFEMKLADARRQELAKEYAEKPGRRKRHPSTVSDLGLRRATSFIVANTAPLANTVNAGVIAGPASVPKASTTRTVNVGTNTDPASPTKVPKNQTVDAATDTDDLPTEDASNTKEADAATDANQAPVITSPSNTKKTSKAPTKKPAAPTTRVTRSGARQDAQGQQPPSSGPANSTVKDPVPNKAKTATTQKKTETARSTVKQRKAAASKATTSTKKAAKPKTPVKKKKPTPKFPNLPGVMLPVAPPAPASPPAPVTSDSASELSQLESESETERPQTAALKAKAKRSTTAKKADRPVRDKPSTARTSATAKTAKTATGSGVKKASTSSKTKKTPTSTRGKAKTAPNKVTKKTAAKNSTLKKGTPKKSIPKITLRMPKK